MQKQLNALHRYSSLFLVGILLYCLMDTRSHAEEILSLRASEERLEELKKKRHVQWEDYGGDNFPLAVAGDLSRLFLVPIHFEKTAVASTGIPADTPRKAYSLAPGKTLQEALDQLALTWKQQVRWYSEGDSFVVVQDPMDPSENLLEMQISVSVQNVSLWDALRAIGTAMVNADESRSLQIVIPGPDRGFKPADAFMRPGTITLYKEDVRGRDAILAVLDKAPFMIRYTYYNLGTSEHRRGEQATLLLYPYPRDDKERGALQHTRELMTPEELRAWNETWTIKPEQE